MVKIDENSIAKLKALFQDNEKALVSNFSQLIDFFNDNKVTDNGDGTFTVGNTIINVNDIVQEPEVRSIILSQLKASTDLVIKEQLDTKADDSKVVHSTDMRKPASDVAGIEEVNAKQDKIGYTPANDSQVAHLSGANNFDTVPNVNNNPLLLASSLPSDLARTGSDQEFTGKNIFDIAPIDKTTGNPYITKSDMPKVTTGLVVKGSVNNASQLPKDGNQEGYCYFVGTDLYVWDAGAWKNCGNVSPDLSNYVTVTDLNNGLSTKVTDNKDGTEQLNGVKVQPYNKLSDTIGGRNYLINTQSPSATNPVKIVGTSSIDAPRTVTFSNGYVKLSSVVSSTASETYYRFSAPNPTSMPLPAGTYTLVVDLTSSDNVYVAPIGQFSTNGNTWQPLTNPIWKLSSTEQRFYYTFTIPSNATGWFISLEMYTNTNFTWDNTGKSFQFRNVSIQKGGVATDSSPAPEDKVNVTDMRKPASDVAGIEEVNAKQDKIGYTPADDSQVAHLSGANDFDTVPTVNNNPLLLASSLPSDLARTGQDTNFTGKLQKSGTDVATKTDVTATVNTAISNMVDSTPPSLTIADDGTYTITAPATTSTPIVKYFLHYNVDGQSDATKLDVGTKLTGNLKELITKPDKTTTYDVQATAMHANTESGASNSVQFTYVPIDESIYGASWDRKSSSTLTRTDAAVGLKAGINGAQNDFDNVGPWKGMHRVTDSMNNVFVRVPKFYIRKTQTGNSDNGTATWQVSLVSHGDDWYLPKGFWDFTNSKELDYIDIGAYAATGSSSKLTSVAGKAPLVSLSIVDFRSAAKANGTGYQIWDIHAWDMLQVLFIIEFATLNSQSIMEGVDNGSSAVNSGAADRHKGSSGTTGSDSNAMSYRGIENLYGNIWQFCDGVNFQNNQPWVCEDATKYQSDLFATPYVKTSYAATSSSSNKYIKALGFDSVHPYAQFSTDDSGSDSAYYADYDYPGSGNTILETGGYWSIGAIDGLFHSGRGNSSTRAIAIAGCRLLKKALS